jgi:hypothetical protein
MDLRLLWLHVVSQGTCFSTKSYLYYNQVQSILFHNDRLMTGPGPRAYFLVNFTDQLIFMNGPRFKKCIEFILVHDVPRDANDPIPNGVKHRDSTHFWPKVKTKP